MLTYKFEEFEFKHRDVRPFSNGMTKFWCAMLWQFSLAIFFLVLAPIHHWADFYPKWYLMNNSYVQVHKVHEKIIIAATVLNSGDICYLNINFWWFAPWVTENRGNEGQKGSKTHPLVPQYSQTKKQAEKKLWYPRMMCSPKQR